MLLLLLLMILPGGFSTPPNIVLFLTDDQDLQLDGMTPMRRTIKLLADEGVVFSHAYAHSPICCPSRSSLLTGRYLHNVRVFNNSVAGNCDGDAWRRDAAPMTFANVLHTRLHYRTFYAGKYLNQYGVDGDVSIPVGWDWWYGLVGNSKYFNFTLSVNGTRVRFTNGEYLTDLLAEYAEAFLRTAMHSDRPFLMVLATPAAHAPFTPAPRHLDAFADVKVERRMGFNHTPHNKHWLLQLPPEHLPTDLVPQLDAMQRARWQTLLAVDELVERVMNALTLNNTYVMFTSDNGFHIGQYGMPWDKRQPYETDINVPLLVRGPHVPRKRLNTQPVSLVDVAPSLLQLAGVDNADTLGMDGLSFADVITGQETRTTIYIEYFGEANIASVSPECGFHVDDAIYLSECTPENLCKCQDARNNSYACVLTFDKDTRFKYCAFADDVHFVEAYDLRNDPNETHNIAAQLEKHVHAHYTHLLNQFRTCAGRTCHQINNN